MQAMVRVGGGAGTQSAKVNLVWKTGADSEGGPDPEDLSRDPPTLIAREKIMILLKCVAF